MKITKRSIVLTLTGLIATSAITGIGMATHHGYAQESTDAPVIGELFVPPPPNVRLTNAALDFVRKTTGKLYVTFSDGYWQWGTATVVNSESKDMLLTSASVLTDGRKGHTERAVQVRFVPGQRRPQNGIDPRRIIEPFGSWTARTWTTLPGFNHDTPVSAQNNVAVVLLNPHGDEHIQDAVRAAQEIYFDGTNLGRVHVFAYHEDFLNGESLDTTCQVIANFRDPRKPFGTCIEGKPTLGKGSSGAPVIAELDPNTGIGRIVAINTWTGPNPGGKTANGGAYLSRDARALYEGYRRQ